MSEVERSVASSDEAAELRLRLELTYAAAGAGIWDWDLRDDSLLWSARMMRMFGVDPTRFTPRVESFFDRLHPGDLERIRQALDDHVEKRVPYDVEYRLAHEDGRWLRIHARGQAFWDEAGRPVRMVGSVEDVTAQIATRQALADSQQRFEYLAESIPGAIFRFSLHPDGTETIEYMSAGCIDIWEIDADVIQSDPSALWSQVDEEDLPAMQASVARSAQRLEPWSHRWRIVTPSGARKWLHGRGRPILQEDGSVLWKSLILDVTEQVRTEEELAVNRELFHRAQRMESLGALTGGLAHDFNNLLAVVLGNLEMLQDEFEFGEANEFLDSAIGAVERGGELTRSLLAFARRAKLDPQPQQMDEVLGALQKMLRRTVPENIGLELDVEDGLPAVVLDRGTLESSVLNLIVNARDAIDGDGRIRVSCARFHRPDDPHAAPWVRISIEDDGCGMDEETVARVFEPFFTTKGSGRGTGLGLSMVEGFVRQSGGALGIDSEPGRGTTVTLSFPAASHAEIATHDAGAGPTHGAGAVGERQGGHILVVEDESELRRVLCSRLRTEGFIVAEAPSGDDGLAVYESLDEPLDLLLTDFIMPGRLQGPDLAAVLRQRQPDLAVIYLSGYVEFADGDDEAEYLRADARLSKPVDKGRLVSTLRSVLARRAEATVTE